jgi:hypothetical protein
MIRNHFGIRTRPVEKGNYWMVYADFVLSTTSFQMTNVYKRKARSGDRFIFEVLQTRSGVHPAKRMMRRPQ